MRPGFSSSPNARQTPVPAAFVVGALRLRVQMFHRAALVLACVGCTLGNVVACFLVRDEVHFPHLMMSDFITRPAAAAIVNVWWLGYIAIHFVIEWRLLGRVLHSDTAGPAAAAAGAKRLWVATLGSLWLGWLSMALCLKYDINGFPTTHSVLGGVYGASWLVTQGARAIWFDGDRAARGLARAPGCAKVRLALCALELASAPFIATGMLIPIELCPDWLSWVCILGEHLVWCHFRLVFGALSYYPDAALLDAPPEAVAPPAPEPTRLQKVRAYLFREQPPAPSPPAKKGLKKVLSSENIKTLLRTIETVHTRAEPRKRTRLGFRSTVLGGNF